LVWGGADPFFTVALGRRLAEALRAEIEIVDGARTFLPFDAPERVAAVI
jgi:pimeloyl-ACP methyl ester carboxylesterase